MKNRSIPAIFLLLALIVAIGLSLSGCSGLADRAENNDFYLKVITREVTLDYVKADSGGTDGEKVNRVYDQALDIERRIDKDDSVTVAELEFYLISKTDWPSLSQDEARRRRLFIAFFSHELQKRVDTQDTRVLAEYFVDTIKNTLEPYRL